jgi:hypothetical protein
MVNHELLFRSRGADPIAASSEQPHCEMRHVDDLLLLTGPVYSHSPLSDDNGSSLIESRRQTASQQSNSDQ